MTQAEKILASATGIGDTQWMMDHAEQLKVPIPTVLEAMKLIAWEAWWVKCMHGSFEEYQRKEFEQWYNKQLDK